MPEDDLRGRILSTKYSKIDGSFGLLLSSVFTVFMRTSYIHLSGLGVQNRPLQVSVARIDTRSYPPRDADAAASDHDRARGGRRVANARCGEVRSRSDPTQ